MRNRSRYRGLLPCLVILGLRCSIEQTAGGTGSEDVNSRVECSAVYADGSAASRALVRIRPADYLADTGSAAVNGPTPAHQDLFTDTTGHVVIDSLPDGAYCIEVLDTSHAGAAVGALEKIAVASSDTLINLGRVVLQQCARITGTVDRSVIGDTTGVLVRIRGLERSAVVDASGNYTFANVPRAAGLTINFTVETTEFFGTEIQTPAIQDSAVKLAAVMPGGSFSPELMAVRTILDSNGLRTVWAGAVAYLINGSVDSLSLVNLGLTVMPPCIGALGKLRVLDVSGNGLSQLPDELGRCTRLRKLVCDANAFRGLPNALFSLDSLSVLSFQNNQLDSLSARISACGALRELYMESNRLVSVPREVFALPNLAALSVAANAIGGLPGTVGACSTLVKLSIADNAITALPASLCSLTNLRELLCEKNRLDSLPACIGSLTSLLSFNASGNNLTSLPQSIMAIPYISFCRVDTNRLCAVDSVMAGWLNRLTPGWDTTQVCP